MGIVTYILEIDKTKIKSKEIKLTNHNKYTPYSSVPKCMCKFYIIIIIYKKSNQRLNRQWERLRFESRQK
jgi:hypothetical protein